MDGIFTVATLTFSYSLLQCNDPFVIPKKLSIFKLGAFLSFHMAISHYWFVWGLTRPKD